MLKKYALPLGCVFIALRVWLLVGAQPVVGFGNNFDFARQSACVGLWEDYGDRPKLRPHPEGPAPRLIFDGDRQKFLCMASSDNLFPYLAAHTHRQHDRVDLREVGLWKALAALALCAFLLAQPMPTYARAFLALAIGLTLGDIDTLSYANTLYLEFSVLAAGIAALAACAVIVGRTAVPRWRDLAAPVVAVVWLGLAKQQYGGLAIALACVGAVVLATRWRKPRQAAVLAAAGVGAAVAFNMLNATPWGLVGAADAANRTDTFLGAVLPAAADRAAALRRLGLPASCGAAIGRTWYSPGLQAHHPCPAVLRLGRSRLAALFVSQPGSFTIPMAHGIALTQRAEIPGPDRWERPADARRLRYRVMRITSPTVLLARLPAPVYRALVAATMLAGLAALPWVLPFRARWRAAGPGAKAAGYGQAMVALGGLTVFYAVASTVFGDGYQDARRHAALVPVGLVFGAVGLACAAYERFSRRIPASGRRHPSPHDDRSIPPPGAVPR